MNRQLLLAAMLASSFCAHQVDASGQEDVETLQDVFDIDLFGSRMTTLVSELVDDIHAYVAQRSKPVHPLSDIPVDISDNTDSVLLAIPVKDVETEAIDVRHKGDHIRIAVPTRTQDMTIVIRPLTFSLNISYKHEQTSEKGTAISYGNSQLSQTFPAEVDLGQDVAVEHHADNNTLVIKLAKKKTKKISVVRK